jgi:ABC-2 type transport system permease protein
MFATYIAQITATIRIAFADRTNFFLQIAGMAVNNGFFFLLWILFFAGFRSIGGWQFADVCLLLGIIMTVVGIAGVFFGGYRDMAAAILRGEADALLTQPKAVLPRLLARESLAHAWGDLVTGTAMLAALAGLDATRIPLAMLSVALGLTVYISASVTFASLAFWIAGARSFARDLTDLPGRRGGCPPRPPQIRTCPIRAYGSSRESFVRAGVAVNDPGHWQ